MIEIYKDDKNNENREKEIRLHYICTLSLYFVIQSFPFHTGTHRGENDNDKIYVNKKNRVKYTICLFVFIKIQIVDLKSVSLIEVNSLEI